MQTNSSSIFFLPFLLSVAPKNYILNIGITEAEYNILIILALFPYLSLTVSTAILKLESITSILLIIFKGSLCSPLRKDFK